MALTRYEITHVSRYVYTSPVRGCVMALCLQPSDEPPQRLLEFDIATTPLSSMNSEQDGFGNTKHVINIHREHAALEIVARSEVETAAAPPPSGVLGADAWEEIRAWRDSFEHWDYTHPSILTGPSASLGDFVVRMGIRADGHPLEALTALSDTLHRSFEYVPGITSAASPIDHVLETGRGVCQDYAHVMLAIARSWGVPSRYVSGYVAVDSPAGRHGVGVPRMGRVPAARPRLDRLRPHQRPTARRRPRTHRSRPRLRRRSPHPRRPPRRRRQQAGSRSPNAPRRAVNGNRRHILGAPPRRAGETRYPRWGMGEWNAPFHQPRPTDRRPPSLRLAGLGPVPTVGRGTGAVSTHGLKPATPETPPTPCTRPGQAVHRPGPILSPVDPTPQGRFDQPNRYRFMICINSGLVRVSLNR